MAALLMSLASVALAGFFCGCSKNAPAANVDLKAQLEVLKGTDKDARLNAFVALGSMKQAAAPAVQDMITYLKDPDPEIRRLAAYVLMEIGPAAAAAKPHLEALLQDSDRTVVTQVVNTMRAIDPNALKDLPLQKLMNSQ